LGRFLGSVQVRLGKAEFGGVGAVQRQLLVEGGVGQVDQAAQGVGVGRPSANRRT